jgi:hypothetical protein
MVDEKEKADEAGSFDDRLTWNEGDIEILGVWDEKTKTVVPGPGRAAGSMIVRGEAGKGAAPPKE